METKAGKEAIAKPKRRRSVMYMIGDTMLKAQVRAVKDADGEKTDERTSLGEYGRVYLDRKKYEIDRNPEIKPIIAHRRAQRYMEKKLLKDLWVSWRKDAGTYDPVGEYVGELVAA
jgi:hypothetical protein